MSLFLFSVLLEAGNINIAVAANVSYAMDELSDTFTKEHPEIKLYVTLGSSGKLTAQIKNGAPYGVFLSANMKYPETLYAEALALTSPRIYAQGSLAYFSAKKRDFSKPIRLLENKNIKKIAIANPKTAPYGKAAVEALQKAKVYEAIKPKLVYAHSISQTVSYVMTAVDLGIVAKSSLYSTKMRQFKENENWESVNTQFYTPIKQGIVLLKYAKKNAEYRLFYDFILSDKAKIIFKKYGYQVSE